MLRYDQPGHGDSTALSIKVKQTSFQSLAEDVILLLQHLGISQLAAWIGVSMGAATGVYVARAVPGLIKQLVLCDTLSCSPSCMGATDTLTPRAELVAQDETKLSEIIDGIASKWFSPTWGNGNIEELSRVTEIMRTTTALGFRTCVNALTAADFDLRPVLLDLNTSVESVAMIVGQLDTDFPQSMSLLRSSVQDAFKSIPLVEIPSAGHLCYIDNGPAFLNAVLSILGR